MICKMAAVPWVRRMSCSSAAGFRRKAKVAEIKKGPVGEKVSVRGWVRTLRRQANLGFVEVNDGSCLSNLQCVVGPETDGYEEYVASNAAATGASVQVDGELVASPGSKQSVEVKAQKILVIGGTDPSFPIQKKNVSSEFLRTKAHLRPRTNKFGAVARVRSDMELATHLFCKTQGAVSVRTPIITTSDCEGAGELFRLAGDFFDQAAFLTVSGQLNAEAYASALSDVYTFGPTFRAENSNTSRHLAEFWMLEVELAFADLDEDIAYATAYLKYVVKYILENCQEDMEFFNTWIEKGIIDRLTEIVEKQFVEMTYTEAVDLLLKSKKKFEFPVVWGSDLQSEHERYITEVAFNGCPVIIRDYPKEVKAFYMRQNDDGKTVAAMDLLVPRVGELIGGSQREERLEHLEKRMDELKLNKEGLWWYLDLRRYGSVPHAGFGLGFERFVQFVTGVDNIKDTIPFPRTPGSADF